MGALLISPRFEAVHGQLGTTFGGNHLACAGALAVLDVIEREKLIENAAAVGQYLLDELGRLPKIKEVRGKGLMISLKFNFPIQELRKRRFSGKSKGHIIINAIGDDRNGCT